MHWYFELQTGMKEKKVNNSNISDRKKDKCRFKIAAGKLFPETGQFKQLIFNGQIELTTSSLLHIRIPITDRQTSLLISVLRIWQ